MEDVSSAQIPGRFALFFLDSFVLESLSCAAGGGVMPVGGAPVPSLAT